MLTVDLDHQPFTETASTPQAAATGAPRWEHSLPPMQKMLRYSTVNQPRGGIGLKVRPLVGGQGLVDDALAGVGASLERGKRGADGQHDGRQRHVVQPGFFGLVSHDRWVFGE